MFAHFGGVCTGSAFPVAVLHVAATPWDATGVMRKAEVTSDGQILERGKRTLWQQERPRTCRESCAAERALGLCALQLRHAVEAAVVACAGISTFHITVHSLQTLPPTRHRRPAAVLRRAAEAIAWIAKRCRLRKREWLQQNSPHGSVTGPPYLPSVSQHMEHSGIAWPFMVPLSK